MSCFEYGISSITFGEDNIESKVVTLGDGMTRIASIYFDGGYSGLVFVRSEKINGAPFQEFAQVESEVAVNQTPDDEKLYLLFNDEKSIDAIEAKLREARKSLRCPPI